MSFEALSVRPEIIQALNEIGIEHPTNIQESAIPIIKTGKDLIGISKTGSGKTAAFGVPIIEKIEANQGLQVLIMAPTRELACQIASEMQKFSKYLPCSIVRVYGGVAISPQIDELMSADIVVGTPGRLCDHLQRGTMDLSRIKCVVLDEADKMVDMGFIQDIERLLGSTPNEKQVLLFGATISSEINRLKQNHMHSPEIAKTETQVQEEYLEQSYYDTMPQEKFSLLVHLLKNEQIGRAIIFCSKISTVDILSRNLRNQDIRVQKIHGKLTQKMRTDSIENFNRDSNGILVASAVAARGLDIKDVTHIFNYDLSSDPQEYIHRVGRTARAGESGKAITLLSDRDHDVFRTILRDYDINIKKLEKGEFPRLHFDIGRSFDNGGGSRFGNRGSGNQSFGPRRNPNNGGGFGGRSSFGGRR